MPKQPLAATTAAKKIWSLYVEASETARHPPRAHAGKTSVMDYSKPDRAMLYADLDRNWAFRPKKEEKEGKGNTKPR